MSFQWSFSTDKLFRRCRRQLFFREIAAHPTAKDSWRREAFILKQIKTLELWRGTLIHEGIEKFLVPELNSARPLSWDSIVEKTIARAKAQLQFSEQKRYRELGITKGKNDNFCALIAHENGTGVSTQDFEAVCQGIRTAFDRLASLETLWEQVNGAVYKEAEVPITLKLPEATIKVQIDLLLERAGRKYTIIDWKSYAIGGDTDAQLQTTLYGWALMRTREYKVRQPENITLLEVQVQEGIVIEHAFTAGLIDELDDYIYCSLQNIFSVFHSKKLGDARLEDFAFTENPNNCAHCVFKTICIETASGAAWTEERGVPQPENEILLPFL